MQYIIMCRSLTYAQRAQRVLERGGVFASVTKAPQKANPRGCTYGVKIGERNLNRALDMLADGGIKTGKVFELMPDGDIREVVG